MNPHKIYGHTKALEELGYRGYYPSQISPKGEPLTLHDQSFYEGFVCPHGHTIRDQTHHWCAKCVMKISSNVCGLDVNFINEHYRGCVVGLLNKLPSHLGPGMCWPVEGAANPNKRLVMPTWRNCNGPQKIKVTYRRAIYTLFWGDIGTARVTRAAAPYGPCDHPDCCNPLHLVSSFNTCPTPPRDFAFFELNFVPEKLALMSLREAKGISIDDIHKLLWRPSIRDPRMGQEKLGEPDYCTYE